MTTTSLPVFVLLLLPQLPRFCWACSYLSRLHFPAPPLQRGTAKWLFWPMGCERKRERTTSVSCPILHSFPTGWEGDSDADTSHHKAETTYWGYVWTTTTRDKKQNSVFVYTPLCVGPPCYSNCDGTLTKTLDVNHIVLWYSGKQRKVRAAIHWGRFCLGADSKLMPLFYVKLRVFVLPGQVGH